MSELNTPVNVAALSSTSPPPNCAICLGPCTNNSYSDSCMHQFCFKCLLEWSKVKAECPLCKQPFTSIIHNVKSISEYDEHVVTTRQADNINLALDDDQFLYLPPAPSSRHFQFRTTFTVDSGGEFAIQQMLLTHPLTNPMYMPYGPTGYGRFRGRPARRSTSSTNFRRSVYNQNLWVIAPPDLTGRYRDASPHYYSENPAARNRLVPWLNRELNALLHENTQQIMTLVDVIMDHLLRFHIRSRTFKNLLTEHLENKTDQFIHEFYSFMRSPYDMVGYDRNVIYRERPPSPASIDVLDFDDDSDVAVVSTSTPRGNNPFHRPMIEVIEINSESSHDSDVIIREPTPPVVVNLVDSDSENGSNTVPEANENQQSSASSEENRKPLLPLKIRLKNKRFTSSSSSSSSSESSDDSGKARLKSKFVRKQRKLKHKYQSKSARKNKSRPKTSSSSFDDEPLLSRKRKFDSDDDNIPLTKLKGKRKKTHSKKSRKVEPIDLNCFSSDSSDEDSLPIKDLISLNRNGATSSTVNNGANSSAQPLERSECSYYNPDCFYNSNDVANIPLPEEKPFEQPSYCPYNNFKRACHLDYVNNFGDYSSQESLLDILPPVRPEYRSSELNDVAGPSCSHNAYNNYINQPTNLSSNKRLRSVIVKEENSNMWYMRTKFCASDSSD